MQRYASQAVQPIVQPVIVNQRYQVRYVNSTGIQKLGFSTPEEAKRHRDELAQRSIDAVAVDIEKSLPLD